jgi:hypothetical protein
MEKDEFKALLKEAKLSKTSLSKLLGVKYQSVNTWGNNNRGFPYWVKSWLQMYILNLEYDNFKKLLKNSNICNEIKLENSK